MSLKRVVVVYGTDFAGISPGGIRTYIEVLSEYSPKFLSVEYVGVSSKDAPASVGLGKFIGLSTKRIFGRLNLGFLVSLLKMNFEGYELAVCHRAETAILMKVIHRKKVFLTLHGGSLNAFRGSHKIFGIFYPFIELIAVLMSDRTQAVNLNTINPITRFLGKVEQAPIVIKSSLFYPANQSGSDIFLIGRLEREKRFDLAMKLVAEAEAKIKLKLSLKVIGEGSIRKDLERISSKLNLTSKFYGQMSSKEIGILLRNYGKVLLITSRFEGMPIVAIEALASGLQVIALKGPGIGKNLAKYGVTICRNNNEVINSIVMLYTNQNLHHTSDLDLNSLIGNSPNNYWKAVIETLI